MSQFNDEKQLMSFHQNLEDVTEDQLSLASIHYMRSHYPEAIDIYKRLLLQNRSGDWGGGGVWSGASGLEDQPEVGVMGVRVGVTAQLPGSHFGVKGLRGGLISAPRSPKM